MALAGAVSAAAPATEPQRRVGTIAAVVAADTLDVRLASGRTARIRVAGVRAPVAGACYAGEASSAARDLALGKRVELVRDRDGSYVTLPGGADLGRLLVSNGLVQIDVWGRPAARFASYVPAQRRAETEDVGMWGACAADVAVALSAAPNPVAAGAPLAYAVTVSNRGPLAAPRVAVDLRSCASHAWYGTCTFGPIAPKGTMTARFVAEVVEPGRISARTVIHLVGCSRPACGTAPLHDPDLRNDETAALTGVADPAATPPPSSPGSAPSGVCHPSYPDSCIPPPPPDLDCADIPFRDFYVRRDIPDADPHSLDGNEDGLGCQFDDY